MGEIDVIGIMSSGMPCAMKIFEDKFQSNQDVRLLAFYPTNLSGEEYENPDFSHEAYRAVGKYTQFRKGLHKKLKRFSEEVTKIKEEDLIPYVKHITKGMPPLRETLLFAKKIHLENLWGKIVIENDLEFYDKNPEIYKLLINPPKEKILEFISNPENRISEKPDGKRKAILCDDWKDCGHTMRSSVLDMFKMGYKDVEFFLASSPNNHLFYKGNYEFYLRIKNLKTEKERRNSLQKLISLK